MVQILIDERFDDNFRITIIELNQAIVDQVRKSDPSSGHEYSVYYAP